MNLNKRIVLYVVILVLFLGIFSVVREPLTQYATDIISFVKQYSNTHDSLVEELRQEIFSQPLRINKYGTPAPLSPAEIIKLTNKERSIQGKILLQENPLLTAAANQKVRDMFDKQYFEHISPTGEGPGALAQNVGYQYVVVGENLAMGNFESNQDLINAWMESIGHRANILNDRYLEIGVAVGRGSYKGQQIWLAVQEFGKPASSCPAVSNSLKITIDKGKNLVSRLSDEIQRKRQELEALPHMTFEDGERYNAMVSEYNELVNKYNLALTELRGQIDSYNQSVTDFNNCARQ